MSLLVNSHLGLSLLHSHPKYYNCYKREVSLSEFVLTLTTISEALKVHGYISFAMRGYDMQTCFMIMLANSMYYNLTALNINVSR